MHNVTITLIAPLLLILALLCFVWAAIGMPSGRFNMVALGLALWVLTSILR